MSSPGNHTTDSTTDSTKDYTLLFPQQSNHSLKDKITAWGEKNIGFLFFLARWIKPTFVFKDFALVTRFKDVQEILSRDDAFNVPYEEKMGKVTNGGNFFLGMAPTPIYERDVSNMRLALRRTDIETIVVPEVRKIADDIVAQTGPQFDFVQALSRIVPTRLMAHYVGVPGPTENELINWTTTQFYYLFFPPAEQQIGGLAMDYAAQFRNYLDQLILQRQQSGEEKDDVLGRLLNMQQANLPGLSNEDIRNNLLGILIGAIPTTSKSATLVLDYLFDNPEVMAMAATASQQDDLTTMKKIVQECLRFNPFGPGIFRNCIQDYKIAKGTLRGTTIRKGTSVMVATQSAMWDEREIKKAKRFDINRPDSNYMHFGYGIHTCFGYHINHVQIPLILMSILKKGTVTRAPGKAGEIKYDGPFPINMHINIGS